MSNSTFTWLDYSEQDRQRMLDNLDRVNEPDTRDELGIGAIRDGLADLLFPGTNTIQTRARYFMFVPWLYLDLERRKTPSTEIAQRAREAESSLITPLKAAQQEGVFGWNAGARLRRLPSSVYWSGLGRWKIRLFSGAQADYHRSLDRCYRHAERVAVADEQEDFGRPGSQNWHAALPQPPDGFPQSITFDLSRGEADYLRERIMASAPNTVLAFLVDQPNAAGGGSFAWEMPRLKQMPTALQYHVTCAQGFSLGMHGAALLYNLMLAEKSKRDDLIQKYRLSMSQWSQALIEQCPALLTTGRSQFWELLAENNVRSGLSARLFVDRWLDLVTTPANATSVADSQSARNLIFERERLTKGGKARLHDRRALDVWGGASGRNQLDYRWRNVQRLVQDIAQGLQGGSAIA